MPSILPACVRSQNEITCLHAAGLEQGPGWLRGRPSRGGIAFAGLAQDHRKRQLRELELKKAFKTVDKVGDFLIFDTGGNKFRLVTAVHFNRQMVFIRHVLTHKEYDKWKP